MAREGSTPPLRLTKAADSQPLSFTPRRVILAGYTGRDRAEVQRHIDELLAQGIPAPERTPELFRLDARLVQVDGSLPKGAGRSSGEVEFVLLQSGETTFVTVGSDHTDRDLEQRSFIDSKRAFPKVIGSQVWPLSDLLRDWDALLLRSWVSDPRGRRRYQEGPLAAIMEPSEILRLLEEDERGDGLVLFSGTIPALEPAPTSGRCRFEGEIVSADGQPFARCDYTYEA